MPKPRAKKSAPKPSPPPKRALHYKVVELSNVDEHSLERTLNEWSAQGWAFDGVQFAMRESSKRPSMGFVFFTREGPPLPAEAGVPVAGLEIHDPPPFRGEGEAERHLGRLARGEKPAAAAPMEDAWSRLAALAGEGDE